MPTSSEHDNNSNSISVQEPRLEGEHWGDLIAVLSPKSNESLDSFDAWMSDELFALESNLAHFSSRRSIKKSLRS